MENYRESKIYSMLIILATYIVAAVVGILVAHFLPLNIYLKVLIGAVAATVVIWAVGVGLKNSSVFDPYWSVMPVVVTLALLGFYQVFSFTAVLMAVAVIIWGIRLTANWAYTFQNLNKQDWRYDKLKSEHPKWWHVINFFGVNLLPTLVIYTCMLPVILALTTPTENYAFAIVGVMISGICIFVEGLADVQMQSFRKKKTGKAIQEGIWFFSRHPNYLGEIGMWWGVYIMSLSVTFSCWWFFIGALANTLMFLFISIPLAEKRNSAREGYAEYKATTGMLIPGKKSRVVKNSDSQKKQGEE